MIRFAIATVVFVALLLGFGMLASHFTITITITPRDAAPHPKGHR